MPCLLGIFAFFMPRVVIVLLWLFSTWIGSAFKSLSEPWSSPLLLPIIGFIFLPYTLLAYCLAIHQNGSVGGLWIVLVVFAVLLDLGVIGGGSKARRKRVVVVEKRN